MLIWGKPNYNRPGESVSREGLHITQEEMERLAQDNPFTQTEHAEFSVRAAL